MVGWLAGWLVCWLAGLVGWLVGWMYRWLIGWYFISQIKILRYFQVLNLGRRIWISWFGHPPPCSSAESARGKWSIFRYFRPPGAGSRRPHARPRGRAARIPAGRRRPNQRIGSDLAQVRPGVRHDTEPPPDERASRRRRPRAARREVFFKLGTPKLLVSQLLYNFSCSYWTGRP